MGGSGHPLKGNVRLMATMQTISPGSFRRLERARKQSRTMRPLGTMPRFEERRPPPVSADALQILSAGQHDDGEWTYLVLWMDGSESWQPASNLDRCRCLVMELWESHDLPCPHECK